MSQAIVDHHALLAAGLTERVETLIRLVESDHLLKAESARQDLVAYLKHEILSHAHGEEHELYPAFAALPESRLIIAGLVDEHHALADLVAELAAASSPVRTAAAARAIGALFETHLHKENELVLPLLAAALAGIPQGNGRGGGA
jgi:hypothetical protein